MSTCFEYITSSFGQSGFFNKVDNDFNHFVKESMINLSRSGTAGKIAARVISPFVGIGAMLASICLRICNIIEPVVGVFVDAGASIYYRNPRPLLNMGLRIVYHLPRNAVYNAGYIVRDFFKIGVVAGVGGIFTTSAYEGLSYFMVRSR